MITATGAASGGALLKLVDFDRINARETHFAVGAINALTGNFLCFDNNKEIIEPEHVIAGGALPMVPIGTDHFWDGGIVSNTPPQHLLDQEDRKNSLVFQVDLFGARGVQFLLEQAELNDLLRQQSPGNPDQLSCMADAEEIRLDVV